MKQQRALERLEQIITPDLEELCRNLIVEDDLGGVWAFGHYYLVKQEQGVLVTKREVEKGTFSSMRTALSWCVADKYQQFVLSEEIIKLDHDRWALKTDIDTRSRVNQTIKDPERRESIDTKLTTKRIKLRGLTERLDKCVSLAKYWQIRGFNNEIARTRRPTPNRTNRPSDRKSQWESH
jgi:hypothetical protein